MHREDDQRTLGSKRPLFVVLLIVLPELPSRAGGGTGVLVTLLPALIVLACRDENSGRT
jgi:hypothetical protein